MFDYFNTWVTASDFSPTLQSILKMMILVGRGIFILIIGLFASYLLRKAIRWFFNQQQKRFPDKNYSTVASVINSLVKYLAYFLIISGILTLLGISTQSIFAVAGIGSIAIGFGAQSIVADLITGATILTENQFRVGDWVEISGKTGRVESIGLRTTKTRGLNGDLHIYPNSTILLVTNSSKLYSRALVEFPVPYTESIDRIFAILRDVLQESEHQLDGILEPPELIGITNLGPRDLTIRITVKTEVGKNWQIERELRKQIRQRFDQEHIAPPYPMQTVAKTDEMT